MEVTRVESADGTPLRLVRWGSGPRDVLMVHGLAEHAGRYAWVGEQLAAAGYRATFVELRGHGESGGQRGHVDHWRRYTEDLWAAAATLPGSYAILAHSMGGLVTLDAVREAVQRPVIGLVITNPLLGLGFDPPKIKVAASGILSRIMPKLNLANEVDASKLSRDPEVGRAYEADPLVSHSITPRWFVEQLGARQRVLDGGPRMTLPMFLLIGDGDQVCSPKAATAFGESYGGKKVVKHYPGYYHEILNEPEKASVMADITDWLQRLPWDG